MDISSPRFFNQNYFSGPAVSNTQSIQIQMSDSTANSLAGAGYSLYAYQAVSTNIPGYPTVWNISASIAPNMTLQYSLSYGAYTSTQTNLVPPEIVVTAAMYPISLGQKLTVSSSTGTGAVTSNGITATISISDSTSNQFTTGITQQVETTTGAQSPPVCALPLFGENLVMVQPLNKVLLVFESGTRYLNQAVRELSAPSILVSMNDVQNPTLQFDLNTNWAANTASWATQYPAQTDISKLLVSVSLTPMLFL